MPDISKIRIIDTVYNVKDEELENAIDILLGNQVPQQEEENKE